MSLSELLMIFPIQWRPGAIEPEHKKAREQNQWAGQMPGSVVQ
jgi:hypothetical protein